MKYKYIFCFLLLLMQFGTTAQGALRITWPLDRTVFQRDANGGTNVWVSGEFGYRQLASGSNGTQFTIFELNKQGGTRTGNIITPTGGQPISISNALSTDYGNIKTFFGNIGRLNTGWYELEIRITKTNYCGQTTAISARRSIKFGVGDVFIIAGQSNASGYTYSDDDGSIPHHTTNLDMPDAVNFLNGRYLINRAGMTVPDDEKIKMPRALPINAVNDNSLTRHDFYALEVTPTSETPATHPEGKNEINIYPNGQASWTWAPMANKMYQNGNQVPMMFFNAAWPGSGSLLWNPEVNGDITNPHWLYGQFRDVLLMYGHIFGVKRILWQQGEADRPPNTTQGDYEFRIGKAISQSRNDLGHSSLGWSLAKSTYEGTRNDAISIDIQNAQQNLAGTLHNKLGASTDDITTWNNSNGRGEIMKVHFSGAAHQTVGDRWANTNITDGIPFTDGQALQELTITDNGNTFRLQAPTNFQRYFWVKNENGLYNTENSNPNHTQNYIDVPKNSNTIDYYTCYMSNDIDDNASNGFKMRMFVSQSFVIPNSIDAAQALGLVEVFSWNAPKVASTKIAKISSKNVDWTITISQNAQDWLSTTLGCGFDGLTELSLVAQENTSIGTRYGTITITGSNGDIETIQVSQSASTNCSDTNLSTKTPINLSGEWSQWGSMHNNQTVIGNTMVIGGESFSNGIGTHAGSTLVYNLANQYKTFSFRVGRDDEADECYCGGQKIQFEVYVDNIWKFTSPFMGVNDAVYPATNTPPHVINVENAGTITLKVTDGGDSNWGDHADWVNAVLSSCANTCTTQAPTPQNVGSSFANGQYTLQATCSTGTPTWANGTNVVLPSVTTTYYVNCVNGACPISATAQTTITIGSGNCMTVSDGLVMGTWSVTGHQLVARKINNYNAFYLTQRINNSPETFVVRAAEMLQRPDVSLNNASYSSLIGCFNHQYSNYGGLTTPNLTNPISLNSGSFYLNYEPDGTPIYTQSTPSPTCNGCTGYLDGAWCSYAIGWAKSGSNGAINVDVYIDNQLVQANFTPNFDRPM